MRSTRPERRSGRVCVRLNRGKAPLNTDLLVYTQAELVKRLQEHLRTLEAAKQADNVVSASIRVEV